jgi:hypothetical protein
MKVSSTAFSLLVSVSSAYGALTQVTGFGANPSNIQMYISVPSKTVTNPAIIVAVRLPNRRQIAPPLTVSLSFTPVVALRPSGTVAQRFQRLQIAKVSFSSTRKRPNTPTAGMSTTLAL